jgi:hypothetical protein
MGCVRPLPRNKTPPFHAHVLLHRRSAAACRSFTNPLPPSSRGALLLPPSLALTLRAARAPAGKWATCTFTSPASRQPPPPLPSLSLPLHLHLRRNCFQRTYFSQPHLAPPSSAHRSRRGAAPQNLDDASESLERVMVSTELVSNEYSRLKHVVCAGDAKAVHPPRPLPPAARPPPPRAALQARRVCRTG